MPWLPFEGPASGSPALKTVGVLCDFDTSNKSLVAYFCEIQTLLSGSPRECKPPEDNPAGLLFAR